MTLPTNCASSKFHSAQHAYYKSSFVANHLAQNCHSLTSRGCCTPLGRQYGAPARSADSVTAVPRQYSDPSGIPRACACLLHRLKVLGYRTMQLLPGLWSLRPALRAVQHNDPISEGPRNTAPFRGYNADFTTTAFSSTVEANCKEPICMQ